MIHQVAIKTLPQEWLWCETWCDDASKKYAKTIDLVCIEKIILAIFSISSLQSYNNSKFEFDFSVIIQ